MLDNNRAGAVSCTLASAILPKAYVARLLNKYQAQGDRWKKYSAAPKLAYIINL